MLNLDAIYLPKKIKLQLSTIPFEYHKYDVNNKILIDILIKERYRRQTAEGYFRKLAKYNDSIFKYNENLLPLMNDVAKNPDHVRIDNTDDINQVVNFIIYICNQFFIIKPKLPEFKYTIEHFLYILFCYEQGWRLSEPKSLLVGHIHFILNQIKSKPNVQSFQLVNIKRKGYVQNSDIFLTKNLLIVCEWIVQFLQIYNYNNNELALAFPTIKPKSTVTKTLRLMFKIVNKRLPPHGFGVHSFRNLKAIELYRTTRNLNNVKDFLGHSKTTKTLEYIRSIDVSDVLDKYTDDNEKQLFNFINIKEIHFNQTKEYIVKFYDTNDELSKKNNDKILTCIYFFFIYNNNKN